MHLDLSRRVRVLWPAATTMQVCLVGVGGTGSALAQALCRLAWHCGQRGTQVQLTFVDPDLVEEKNIGRQLFAPPEVGQNKAETMARRMGTAFGLAIRAVPEPFTANLLAAVWEPPAQRGWHNRYSQEPRLLIGAVDNHLARRALATAVALGRGRTWWLDCGNARDNGQVLMGNISRMEELSRVKANELGLCPALPAPHLQASRLLEPDPTPQPTLSCAELTQREEQSLVVNQMVAGVAAQYAHAFLVRRELTMFATHFTLDPPSLVTQALTEASLRHLLAGIAAPATLPETLRPAA